MGGQSKSQITGYKYSLYAHFIFGAGVADFVSKIWFRDSDTIAWEGKQDVGGVININKPDLFGGTSSQGGVVGQVAFMSGAVDQMPNYYQVGFRGALTPAYRGVMGIIWQDLNIGMNPYLPTWGVEWSRIHKRMSLDGVTDREQWYDEKSGIPFSGSQKISFGFSDLWKYKVEDFGSGGGAIGIPAEYFDPNFDDSSWSEGLGGFGNSTANPVGTIVTPATKKTIWIRKSFNVYRKDLINLKIKVYHDDGGWLWVNGVNFPLSNLTASSEIVNIPSANLINGINVIAFQVIDTVPSGTTAGIYAAIEIESNSIVYDMNPIHIIREFKTEHWSSSRLDESKLPDDIWQEAADTIYNEGLGMTFNYDGSTSIETAISEVARHIGAEPFTDRRDGKFKVKLIRDDYDIALIPHFNESNIIDMSKEDTPVFGQLTTDVVVNYIDTANSFVEASITVQDVALAQQQGKRITANLDYKGFTSGEVAGRKAQQMLNTLSKPLQKRKIVVRTSAGKDLNRGDPIKVSWDRDGLVEMVFRVTELNVGNGISNRIMVDMVQDEFAMPTTSFVAPPSSDWTPPFSEPTALNDRLIIEAPYLELVQLQGQSIVDLQLTDAPESAYVLSVAAAQSNATKAMMYDGIVGYSQVGVLDFCPTAILDANCGLLDGTITITGGKNLDQVDENTWFQIGSELFRFDSIAGDVVTIGRGVLDTIPATHLSGAKIHFWDNASLTDSTEFVISNIVNVKLATINPKGQLSLLDAPTDSIELVGRAARPYNVANIKLNDVYYNDEITSDLVITWANRNRLQQTSGTIYDFNDGNITPESGVTVTVNLLDADTLSIEHSVTGATGTILTVLESVLEGLSDNLILELFTVRDGLESYQKYEIPFNNLNAVKGMLYEDSNTMIYEDNNRMVYE